MAYIAGKGRTQGTLFPITLDDPRLLLRGLTGAQSEIAIATMAYNLKRITNVLGATRLTEQFKKLLTETSSETRSLFQPTLRTPF